MARPTGQALRQPQGLEGPSIRQIKLKVRISNSGVLAIVLVIGCLAGVLFPNEKLGGGLWGVLQSAAGWSYTLAWCVHGRSSAPETPWHVLTQRAAVARAKQSAAMRKAADWRMPAGPAEARPRGVTKGS